MLSVVLTAFGFAAMIIFVLGIIWVGLSYPNDPTAGFVLIALSVLLVLVDLLLLAGSALKG